MGQFLGGLYLLILASPNFVAGSFDNTPDSDLSFSFYLLKHFQGNEY